MLWGGWTGPDVFAALLGVIGMIGGAVGWFSGRKGQRQSASASAEAATAQRKAAEALARQAGGAERLLALEEVRSTPTPVRFRSMRFPGGWRIVNAGQSVAREVELVITQGAATRAHLREAPPTELHGGESFDLSVFRGGVPGSALIRIEWEEDTGKRHEQELSVG